MLKRIIATVTVMVMLILTVGCKSDDTVSLVSSQDEVSSAAVSSRVGTSADFFSSSPFYDDFTATRERYYEFNGSISMLALNNYLDRAINYGLDFTNTTQTAEDIRFITNVGAKYIQRAYGEWIPTLKQEEKYPTIKEYLAKAHEIDPDIVFEVAVFECVTGDIYTTPVPAYVFEAFGQEVKKRNFSVDRMFFDDGYGKDIHGKAMHAPDITELETQMYYYYKATKYIDLGFEAIHFGQTLMTGKNDTNFECWTKVITLVREYAKTHARRGYVIINSHDGGKLRHAQTGAYLVDFIMSPLRPHAAEGETAHAVSEDNPQRCIIEKGWWGDSPYQAGYRGTSPCGEYATNYPYLVEFDNYGNGKPGELNNPESYVWGLDESGWYCNQPQWYRKEFTQYVLDTIDGFAENGHLSVMGHRYGTWYANSTKYMANGKNDEDWIKEIFENR